MNSRKKVIDSSGNHVVGYAKEVFVFWSFVFLPVDVSSKGCFRFGLFSSFFA